MLGYFANWGTSLHISSHTAKQWIDATVLHFIFAGIILIMSMFALESPRWLAKVGRDEQAADNMSKLRKLPIDHPYVRAELIDIHDQLDREREATLGAGIIIQFISMLYIAIYLTAVPSITDTALGWNSIQYLIGAEIFPLRVRSLGTSMIMTFHFANQCGNSKAVPLMILDGAPGLSPKGTFWFFAAVTLLGLGFAWFFLPETAGKSLEGMDEMFNLPWHVIGRRGAEMTRGSGSVAEAMAAGGMEKEKRASVDAEERVEESEARGRGN
ncbi:quinate permease [Diplocarpon rosae]|nr:quinate permease [Diplocarpon rosae]